MAHLPTQGEANWGAALNEFLLVSHQEDGTLKATASMLNARDYGATGNGTTDDTAALQTAINAAAGGRVLLLPAGTYSTRKLLLPSNVTICGEGNSTILRLRDGTLDALFTNQDWTNGNSAITLRNLRVEGNRTNNNQNGNNYFPGDSTAQDKSHGINFHYVTESLLENLTVADFYYDGIYLGSSMPETIPDGGQDRSSGSNRNIIRANRITANGRNGISITRGTDNTIDGNFLGQNNIGAPDDPSTFAAGAITIEPNGNPDNPLYSVSRNIVCNNHLLGNHFNGIQLLKNWLSSGILIASNTISGTGRHGIVAALISGLIIQGNHVSTSKGVGMALGLGGGIKDAVVSGNVVCDNKSTGILVNGAQGDRILVSGNVVTNNCTEGVYGQGIVWVDAQRVTVLGNISVDNNTPQQILLGGADPLHMANRTHARGVPAKNRVLNGHELFGDGWQLYGDQNKLYVENQWTGQSYLVKLEEMP